MPGISLILATAGRTTELHRFFASLDEAQHGVECQCIVVDQNPNGLLLPVLARWKDSLAIQRVKSLPGLSHARNIGLALATEEVLGFPDDDCWYSPGLLADVRCFFADNPRYSLLSVGVRDQSGVLSGNRWLRDRCDLAAANLFRTSVGMALFVRRSALVERVRFDETLGVGAGTAFGSGEDTDYVFQLLAAGLKGRFDRSLTVYHPRRDLLSGTGNAVRAFNYGCGMGRVIRKRAKPLLPAFVAFDAARSMYSLLRGKPEPARLCAAHGRGVFAGFMASD